MTKKRDKRRKGKKNRTKFYQLIIRVPLGEGDAGTDAKTDFRGDACYNDMKQLIESYEARGHSVLLFVDKGARLVYRSKTDKLDGTLERITMSDILGKKDTDNDKNSFDLNGRQNAQDNTQRIVFTRNTKPNNESQTDSSF